MIKRYRRKAAIVEAVRWDETNLSDIQKLDPAIVKMDDSLLITTPIGTLLVRPLYWVVRDVEGNIHPIDPDVFNRLYEEE